MDVYTVMLQMLIKPCYIQAAAEILPGPPESHVMVGQAEDNSDHLSLCLEQETFAPLRPSRGCQGMHRCHYLIVFLADDVPVG